MTNREFFTAIVSANLNSELVDFARNEIAKLDARNAKRASTPSKTAIANEPIKASILQTLANGPMMASEIAVALEISTSKASALCRQLVVDGKASVEDIKVKGKGVVKSYSLVSAI